MIQAERLSLGVEDGSTMAAYLARPEGGGPRPGVIVLQEAFGVNAHIRSIADRLAAEGYAAIAPELFHRTAPGFDAPYGNLDLTRPHAQALTEAGLSADLKAAYEALRGRADVKGEAVGSIGFCMGGRVSYLANAFLPLKAAISFYGARIAPALLDRAPRLNGSLLLVWGGKDAHIPPEDRRAVYDAAAAAGKDVVEAAFSAAGHGFHCDARPSYHPASARAAWALSIAFLKERLGE